MKMIFGLLIIAVGLYLCVELIPPYYTNYELQDAIQTEALLSTNSTKTEDDIRATVYKKVQDLQVPTTKDNIHVTRVGSIGSGSVTIDIPYTVHLDMLFYSTDLHFDASTTNKGAM
jgi:hypothetical protein